MYKRQAYLANNKTQGPDVNNSRIMLRTDYKPASDMQLWAVSGALHRPEDVNLGPDGGVGIKAVADPTMHTFHPVSYTHLDVYKRQSKLL